MMMGKTNTMTENKEKKTDNGSLIPVTHNNELVDESVLFERIAVIIEKRKYRAYTHANNKNTMIFWEVRQYISSVILGNKRATYGKYILTTLSVKLVIKYGKNFAERNIYRMTLFAERFSDVKILPTLSAKLSWSHILELLLLKSVEAQIYYAQEVAERNWGIHELRCQISRKAYKRREIANAELSH